MRPFLRFRGVARRARRRVFPLAVLALAGGLLPAWAPALLSSLPAFRVERVEVVGTRYVAPDEVVRLAGVDTSASVWDGPEAWERRVRAHPLVRQARVHRRGLRALEIRVVEDEPVALAATPELVPVNAEGRILPLDPAEVGLDLPLLLRKAEAEGDRLSSPRLRRLAALLGRLGDYDPGFTSKVSEVALVAGDDIEIRMLESAHSARILLPGEDPLTGLRRVETALSAVGGTVEEADARFEGQVVLRGAPEPEPGVRPERRAIVR